MTQIIYGDVLFIINFSMDFLALFVTAKILRRRANPLGLAAAAAFGAAYAVASLFLPGDRVIGALISVAASVLMCFVAYGWRTFGGFLRCTLLFYLTNFLMAGGITALYRLLNAGLAPKQFYINGKLHEYQSEIPMVTFALLAAISALASMLWGRISEHFGRKKTRRVHVAWQERQVSLTCLSDSGNLLTDPVSGMAVLVADYGTVHAILPEQVADMMRLHRPELLSDLPPEQARRIRLIPYQGVGRSGLLYAFVPDTVEVEGRRVEACVAVEYREEEKAEEERYGGYDGIVPAHL